MDHNENFKTIILPISLFMIVFIIYTSFYEIEEVVKGNGKVVPSQKTQQISHLEGGIIEDIYVKENQKVKKGDKLLKISNTIFQTSINEKTKKKEMNDLKIKRLKALINNTELVYTIEERKKYPNIIQSEIKLYNEWKEKLTIELSKLKSKIGQTDFKLRENKINLVNKKLERKIINERFTITEGLYKKESISKKEYLDAQLEKQKIETSIEELKNNKPILEKEMEEYIKEKDNIITKMKIEYLTEMNKIENENNQIIETIVALQDRIDRQFVISPIEGTISKLNNNTISGIIKQGDDILEITPESNEIIIETEILDRDRSNIWVGQKVKVEFNAYSFSDYGFLDGEIISISPDSFIKKNNNQVFYIVQVKTKTNNIKGKEILSGMTANVNIITGKKTIMEYIIKPIKNIKKSAFTEI